MAASDREANSRSRSGGPLGGIGARAAGIALRPLTDTMGVAVGVGRSAVDRLLDDGEVERFLDSDRFQAVIDQVVRSDGAKQLIDTFFDSGLLDHFLDRLLESDSLWHLVDVIAASPAVRAAVSQQGLGFADQVGGAVRSRSRKADQRIERAALRLRRHRATESEQTPTQHGEHDQSDGVS